MCLSKPALLVEVDEGGISGVVNENGRKHRVSLSVLRSLGATPAPGDWVLMGSGIPVEVIDQAEADELLALVAEVEDL